MKFSMLFLGMIFFSYYSFAQKAQDTEDWSRKPETVTPAKRGKAPSDALVLYSGKKDAGNWQHPNGDPIKWKDGKSLTVVAKTGDVQTKEAFGDIQLHIEWRTPRKVTGSSQGRGNSGIFLMGLYEVQVLDSYENETYYNGQAGSVYKQQIPLVNSCRPPGKWQVYDIFFTAPRFNEEKILQTPAYVTVVQNGIVVQNHVELAGPTVFVGEPQYKFHPDKLPIKLQDHGNPVSYRSIWVRDLLKK